MLVLASTSSREFPVGRVPIMSWDVTSSARMYNLETGRCYHAGLFSIPLLQKNPVCKHAAGLLCKLAS